MMLLYDSSAFFELLKSNELDYDAFLTDLNFYEIGNVLWKHKNILKELTEADVKKISKVLIDWNNLIRIDSESDFEKILEIALKQSITFYDSTYIHFAKKFGLKLITYDKKLDKAAKKQKIKCQLLK